CPYDDGKGRPRHHLWTKGEGAKWSVWGLELQQLPARLTAWKKEGSRPVKFYLNSADPGCGSANRPYGVFLESDLGLDWTAHPELTAAALTKTIDATGNDGWRPDSLSDLGVGANRTYCLTAVPKPTQLKWHFQADMTVKEYEAALVAQKQNRLRPLAVRSEG